MSYSSRWGKKREAAKLSQGSLMTTTTTMSSLSRNAAFVYFSNVQAIRLFLSFLCYDDDWEGDWAMAAGSRMAKNKFSLIIFQTSFRGRDPRDSRDSAVCVRLPADVCAARSPDDRRLAISFLRSRQRWRSRLMTKLRSRFHFEFLSPLIVAF